MKKIFRYVLLSFVVLMLVACGKPDSQKAFEKGFKETMNEIDKKMNEGGNEATKMMAKILQKASYKVNKVEENGNESELDVTIKTVDLTKYLSEFMLSLKPMIEANLGEDAFSKATVDYFSDLSKKELEYTETNIKVYMEKIEGEWKVKNTDDVLIGIFGGLEEFVRVPQ
ncbi:LptM family lipoprotein [Fusobacterium polymorphum]